MHISMFFCVIIVSYNTESKKNIRKLKKILVNFLKNTNSTKQRLQDSIKH